MKRRNFVTLLTAGGGGVLLTAPSFASSNKKKATGKKHRTARNLSADLVIAGGGMGGIATAMAACRNGLKVIMTEETDWIGGQVSQQGVPPDEHRWIETHGAPASYMDYRRRVRAYYKRNYPLTPEAMAQENLNPGSGSVSRLCHEPRVSTEVFNEMLSPFISARKLTILLEHKITGADVGNDRVRALKAENLKTGATLVLDRI